MYDMALEEYRKRLVKLNPVQNHGNALAGIVAAGAPASVKTPGTESAYNNDAMMQGYSRTMALRQSQPQQSPYTQGQMQPQPTTRQSRLPGMSNLMALWASNRQRWGY